MLEIHVNSLRIITPEHQLGKVKTDDSIRIPPSAVPWIGLKAIVCGRGHPLKGQTVVVEDVMINQPTPSGLRVKVQVANYAPSNPFQMHILDYDAIVEAK